MLERKMQFVDIYDVWYQPWWQSSWCYLFCVIIVCSICAFMLYCFYRCGWFVKKLSCDQQALKSLNAMEQASYASSGKIYAVYFQLTLILKTYFSARYHLALVDKTEFEVIALLKTLVNERHQSLLVEFLQRSLVIKFAHDEISEQTLQDDIKFLKKIVEETTTDFDTTKDFDKAGRS